MARTAAVILGRPKTGTGRFEETIARAVRLRLVGVESGSTVPVLTLPALLEEDALEVGAEVMLGHVALDRLLDAGADPHQADPLVAEALRDVADRVRVGDRYEAVTFSITSNGRPARAVRVDAEVRAQLSDYVAAAMPVGARTDMVVGTLVEADFERRTARLKNMADDAIAVQFGEDLADEVHAALRGPMAVRGDVTYDPKTQQVRSVQLHEIVTGEQLSFSDDTARYWDPPDFADLMRDQGTVGNVGVIAGSGASDEEADRFLAALAEFG